jgi:hypothetical protein
MSSFPAGLSRMDFIEFPSFPTWRCYQMLQNPRNGSTGITLDSPAYSASLDQTPAVDGTDSNFGLPILDFRFRQNNLVES